MNLNLAGIAVYRDTIQLGRGEFIISGIVKCDYPYCVTWHAEENNFPAEPASRLLYAYEDRAHIARNHNLVFKWIPNSGGNNPNI